ncbi:hypothetical protein J4457_05980, partial [Candidatus Woesearchaeota archaeon]|nr:hypothetical protein [Candidatus Woesearchaeota archaeon]
MTLKDLKRNLELFKQSITFLKQKKLTPSKKDSKNFTDFQKQQESYHQKSYFNALNSIHEEIENLDKYDEHTILIEKEAQKLTNDNLEKNVQIIANIFDILKEIPEEEQKPRSVKSNTLL